MKPLTTLMTRRRSSMASCAAARRATIALGSGSAWSPACHSRRASRPRFSNAAVCLTQMRRQSSSTGGTAAPPEKSRVFTWGSGTEGQLGHYPFEKSALTGSYSELVPRELKLPEGLNFVDIACGLSYTAAITDDGKLYTWGEGKNHKLGHGDTKDVHKPKLVETLKDVKIVKVSCGDMHTAAVDSEGNLYTWGFGGSFWGGVGGLGHGDDKEQPRPKLVQSLVSYGARVGSVACGEKHTLILTDDGEVLTVGNGEYGRLGNGGSSDVLEPAPLDFFEPTVTIVQAVAGHAFNMVLTADGKVWVWGRNEQGQLGLGGGISMDLYSMEAMPLIVEALEGKKVVSISAGHSHSAAITDQGELYMWGMKSYLEPQLLKVGEDQPQKAAMVSCGNSFTACVTDTGKLYTCGRGSSLSLGHGNKSYTPHPALVQSLSDRKVKRVACGSKHMAVITD